MRHLNIAGKIWLSIGLFVVGGVISLGVSQVGGMMAEARLRTTSEALFPAAQYGQQAEASFERMAKGFQDAVLLEETAALDQAEKDGLSSAADLNRAAALPGLDSARATALQALASAVSALARDGKTGYAPMVKASGNMTTQMAGTSRRLAEQTAAVKKSVGAAREQLAADLRAELATDVQGSVRQRWTSLAVFFLTLALAGAVVTVTIRRSIVMPIQSAVSDLTDTAAKVVGASGLVASSSQSLSQGATEQAASLEETAASMEEMASMTRKNAEHSHEAATLMAEVDSRVKASNTALGDMVTSMASIQESSRQVAKIIKTIDEIAFQTNILALNAAVEAARAGDAGMGFAVVADEVRNLAQRSARAARDTADLIEASIAKAQSGNQKVQQVATSISGITESVVRVKGLVDQVSAASRQQTQGIDQVSQAVAQMEKVTQTTAATAEESAAASEELNAQAETAMSVVGRLEALVGGQRTYASPVTQTSAHSESRATVRPESRAA